MCVYSIKLKLRHSSYQIIVLILFHNLPQINIYITMLINLTKKYSLIVRTTVLNQGVTYKKPKDYIEGFQNSSRALVQDKEQADEQMSPDASSNIKIKLRNKLKVDRMKIIDQRKSNIYDDFFLIEEQSGSKILDSEWFSPPKPQKNQIHSHGNPFLSQQKIDSIFRENDPQKPKINRFIRNLNITAKMENSSKFASTLNCLLPEHKYSQLLIFLRKFINQGGSVEDQEIKPPLIIKQKQLFKNLRNFLSKCIEDQQCVQEIVELFAKCNPKFIEVCEFKKVREFHDYFSSSFNEKKVLKKDLSQNYQEYLNQSLGQQRVRKEKKSEEMMEQLEKNSRVKNNEIMDLIQSLDEEDKKIKKKTRPVKLLLKNKSIENQTKFQADTNNLQKVEKKIFGNKKLVTEQIIIKRVQNKTNEKLNNFGQNWVYCYELPYDFTKEDAEKIIASIEKNYGEIIEYTIHPYRNIIEKNYEELIYVIPDNFQADSKKFKKKIDVFKSSELNNNLEELMKKKQKKTLTTKILEKTKKTKQLNLNKSYMLFKFKKIQDKTKFLIPEMRLFGLNIGHYKNIKFEDAQAKTLISLTMIPWGCESQDIIKLINDVLLPLKVTVTYPNCIIAKSFIFVELANFYEAFYAKDLLNNYIFQNQRLKCQIHYGSIQFREGQYKHNMEASHYERLVQKLSDLRNFYEEDFN